MVGEEYPRALLYKNNPTHTVRCSFPLSSLPFHALLPLLPVPHQDLTQNAANISPTNSFDLPQSELETIFVRYGSQHGFPTRFSAKLFHYSEEASTGIITSTLFDTLTQ